MLLKLLRWPRLLQGCAQQTFTVQNKPAAVATRNHHASFLRFWNWAEENCRCAKIRRAENVIKNRNQQTFVNGLLGFITLGIYTIGSACVLLTIIAWVAHRYGQLYLHCSLIYFWVPSSCFCIVISLSEGEIIPFSGVCRRGEAALSTRREAVVASRTDWQTAYVQPTTTSGKTLSRRYSGFQL